MRFLFTTFEGGGHVPPPLAVASALQVQGHEVLFISDAANRRAAEALGLRFDTWRNAPNRQSLGGADDPLRDWKPKLPHAVVRAVCEGVICGPAAAYAADASGFIDAFRPDVVVSNELLFGVMMAAEARGARLALLTSNVWCFPTRRDQPPFGPGFPPARSRFERQREAAARRMIAGWYDAGLGDLNQARAGLGLPPLAHVLDQLSAAHLVLLGVSQAFDYGGAAPAGFVYVGPLGQRPGWARADGDETRLLDPGRPNVLVSFSTTHQNQAAVLRRTARALAGLDVHAIVTLGPALKAARLPKAANLTVVEHADHDVLVPLCDAMICHGGHGTVLRPLAHGRPVVVIPSGRDQPENAQRIVWAGAGRRLPRWANVSSIRRAIREVLEDRRYAHAAQRLAANLAVDSVGPAGAVAALEAMALSKGGSSVLRRPAAE